MGPKVRMYTTGVCPYCNMAERLLKAKGIDEIEKIRVDLQPDQRVQMMEMTGPSYRTADLHWRDLCGWL
jgi:glutaredoxin 3